MVKHENFKTCEQSGFCKRNRAYADNAATLGNTWASPYKLDPNSIQIGHGYVTGTVLKSLRSGGEDVKLPFKVAFLESGVARVIMDELKRQQKGIELRHGSQVRKERYNEAAAWALVKHGEPDKSFSGESGREETIVRYGPKQRYRAVIRHYPFSLEFFRDDEVHIKLNGKGLLNIEHWRPKVEKVEQVEGKKEKNEEGEDESTWWEESFGGNTDSKPRGPESVGVDIDFIGYEYVYGIPGHGSTLSLKQTRYYARGLLHWVVAKSYAGAELAITTSHIDYIIAIHSSMRWTVP